MSDRYHIMQQIFEGSIPGGYMYYRVYFSGWARALGDEASAGWAMAEDLAACFASYEEATATAVRLQLTEPDRVLEVITHPPNMYHDYMRIPED